ncbi:MAG TPA: hypothetical protein VF183_09545, partial [Acidimicrobiales bacterium]
MHRSVKTTARRGRHRLVATITLVACAALAAVASPAAASGADNGPPPGRGTKKRHADPTIGPLVAGTASYIDGTFVWTDYALDDRGPNTVETSVVGPRCTTPGGPDCSGGDAAYAPWAAPGNTADLIQLQIGADHRGVTIRAVLGSLVNPSLPVLGVAFDTDADTATGAATLPGGRWPAVDPLGVEKLVVASADGAQLWSHLTGSWQRVDLPPGLLRAHVDPERNTIDVRIHHSVLPATSGVWRAFGVLGVQNPDGGSWVDGSEEIMDLAFVGNEPFVRWQENRQADILAGTRATTHAGLSSAEAAAQLDWNKIWGRVTELTDATSPGFHTYLFRSKLDLPEGVTTPAPEVSLGQHEYLGPYQPYLVFIPESPPPGNPLTVDLHGANNNHLQSIFVVPNGDYVGTSRQGSEDFFLVTQFVPDVGVFPTLPETITIYPLGRGETLGYRGISEIDVLEATADAIERLDIDPNRVSLQG